MWKEVSHHMSSGKCKLKQWETTTHLSEHKIQNNDNIKCWQGCATTGTLIHCWWECKMVQPLWKTVWQFWQNIIFSYDPAIALLDTYSKELKTYTWMLTAALLITGKTWKQPRCPLLGEWINELWTSWQWNVIPP